jgi:hypothetical protein
MNRAGSAPSGVPATLFVVINPMRMPAPLVAELRTRLEVVTCRRFLVSGF